jgi:phage-related protein
MVFDLIGRDRVSRTLEQVGRSAGTMRTRITAASTASRAQLTQLSTTASTRLGATRARADAASEGMQRALERVGNSATALRGRYSMAASAIGRAASRVGLSSRVMRQEVAVATEQAAQDVDQFVRDANGRLHDLRGRFVAAGAAARRDLGDGVGDGSERSRRGLAGLLGPLGRVGGALSALGPAAGSLARVGALAGSAIPAAAGLASALAAVAPAAGVGATGILAVVSAAGALKVGMLGVNDAITKAFDGSKAEDFNKALAKLSPNAKSFVLALQGLKPQLDGLRKSVQDKLFAGLDSQLTRTATAVLPALKRSLGDAASALNLMGRDTAKTARELGTSGTLGTALKGATGGLRNLKSLPGTIVQGLVQVGAAAAPAFQRLTASGGGALAKLRDKMNKAFKSGAMTRAIDQAVSLLGQLASVAGNVFKIVGNVFGAAQANGGGLIGTLKTITGELAKVTASPAVQQALGTLFQTMATLAKTAAPLLGQALSAIGPVITTLGPPIQTLIGSLGSALSPIIAALGPVLRVAAQAVGSLANAIAPLLPIVGQLVAAVLPSLSPILAAVGQVFAQMAPYVKTLATTLSGMLQPILAVLPGVITPLVGIFTTLTGTLFPVATQLVVALSPSLVQLSKSFSQILVALSPLLTALGQLIGKVLKALLPVITPIIAIVGKLAAVLANVLSRYITGVTIPALKILTSLLRGDFSGAWSQAKTLVGNVGRFIGDMFSKLGGWAKTGISAVVRAVGSLGGLIKGALAGAGSWLMSAGRAIISGLISGIKGMFGSVKSTLGDLTSKITRWKGPPRRDATLLTPAGRLLIRGLIRGITGASASLRSTLATTTRDLTRFVNSGLVKGLTGSGQQIRSAYKQLTSLLTRELITNMDRVIRTDRAKLETLARQRAKLAERIAKTKDKGDRSKYRRQDAEAAREQAALRQEIRRAQAVQRAGSNLTRWLASQNSRLTALAAQRDRIAARIAEARKFASDTASTARGTAALGNLGLENVTASGIRSGLQSKLARIRQFSRYISILGKRGLSKSLLRQIVEMGPEQGYAYASALAGASGSMLRDINKTQGAIDKASTGLGRNAADLLYDSGKNAGKGFLTGLQGQKKAIEKLMLDIAKGMQAAIRRALGIKSPSTVMAGLGRHITQGLAVGVLRDRPVLAKAMGALSDTVSSGVTAGAGIGAGAGVVAGGGQQAPVVTITVNGALDPVAVGRQIQKVLLELKRTYGVNINLGVG